MQCKNYRPSEIHVVDERRNIEKEGRHVTENRKGRK